MADTLVDQVLAQVSDARQRLAMLLGAALEGGWGPTYGAGDGGTSFGPFQMHWGGALGPTPTSAAARMQSRANAEDPAWAVAHMKGAYASAVAQIPGSLWKSNPEAAAETAARLAERPARDYVATDGQNAVDAAYGTAAKAAATGGGGGSWLDTAGNVAGDVAKGVTNPIGAAGEAVGGILGFGAKAASSALGSVVGPIYSDFKNFAVKMAFTGLGLGLVTIGLYQTAKPTIDRAAKTAGDVAGAAVVAA